MSALTCLNCVAYSLLLSDPSRAALRNWLKRSTSRLPDSATSFIPLVVCASLGASAPLAAARSVVATLAR